MEGLRSRTLKSLVPKFGRQHLAFWKGGALHCLHINDVFCLYCFLDPAPPFFIKNIQTIITHGDNIHYMT